LRVLILEDVPADAELTARALEPAGINARVKVVDTRESFTEELTESPPDLILADYSLPGFDGEQALEISRTIAPEVPFIFVTGTLGEEHAVELMKQGAWDYVTKEHLSRLGSLSDEHSRKWRTRGIAKSYASESRRPRPR